jgi:hypothetical protein
VIAELVIPDFWLGFVAGIVALLAFLVVLALWVSD